KSQRPYALACQPHSANAKEPCVRQYGDPVASEVDCGKKDTEREAQPEVPLSPGDEVTLQREAAEHDSEHRHEREDGEQDARVLAPRFASGAARHGKITPAPIS